MTSGKPSAPGGQSTRSPAVVQPRTGLDWPEVVVFAFVAIVALALAVGAPFWTDEHWYFAGAWAVAQGALPHRDFFFHHNPLVLYVFALPQRLWGPSLLVGRLEAWVLWVGAMAGLVILSGRLAGLRSARITLGFVATNIFVMRFFVTVDWRVVEAAILVATFWVATQAKRPEVRFPALAALLALNVTLRYSIDISGMLLLLVLAYVLLRPSVSWRTRGGTVLAAVAVLALAMAPVMRRGAAAVVFDTIVFPLQMTSLAQASGLLLELRSPIGALFWSTELWRQALEKFSLVMLPFVAVVAWRLQWVLQAPIGERMRRICGFGEWWWLAVLYVVGSEAMLVLSLSGTPVTRSGSFVVAALLVAVEASRFYDAVQGAAARRAIHTVVAVAVAAAVVLQDLPTAARVRLSHTDVAAIANAGRVVARYSSAGDSVFTFSPVIATAAGRAVGLGMLMETYGLVPSWSAEESAAHRMVNGRMIVEALASGRYPVVVLQRPGRLEDDVGRGRLLTPYRAEIVRALESRYVLSERVPGPTEGNGATMIEIFLRR